MKNVSQISAEEAARIQLHVIVHVMNILLGLGPLQFNRENGVPEEIETGLGGGRLLRNGQLKAAIGSFFTSNPEAVAAAQSGALRVELLPHLLRDRLMRS